MPKKTFEVASLRNKNGEIKKEYRKDDGDEARVETKRNSAGSKKKAKDNDDYRPEAAVIAQPLTDAQAFENAAFQINKEIMPETRARGETAMQVVAYNNADAQTKSAMLEEVLTFATMPAEVRRQSAEQAGLKFDAPKNSAHSDNYSITVSIGTGKYKNGKEITEPHQIDIVKDGKLQALSTRDQGRYILHVNEKAANARAELKDSKVGQTFDISHFTKDYEGAELRGSGVAETVLSAYMADVSVDYCKHSGIKPHILQEDPRIVKMVEGAIDSGKLPKFYGNYNMGLRGEIADNNAKLYPQGAHITISNHFDGAIHGNRNGTFGQVNPDVEASKVAGRYILSEVDSRGVVNSGGIDNQLISSHRGFQTQANSPAILIENGNGYSVAEANELLQASNVRQQAYAIFNGVVKSNLANGNTLYNSPQALLASNELGIAGKEIKPEQMLAHYQYHKPEQTPLAKHLEQQLLAQQQGVGDYTKPSEKAPQDIASALGFAPATPQPEKALPVREQILAAAEVTGNRIKQYVSAQGDALSEILNEVFVKAEANAEPKIAQVEPVAPTVAQNETVAPEATAPVVAMEAAVTPVVAQVEATSTTTQAPEVAPAVQSEVAAAEPVKTDNPFNVEQAIAKAEIQPAEAKPQTPEDPKAKEQRIASEEEAFIKEMFAKFNPENGKPIIVKQTYDELSPKEREATTFVQTVLGKLEYLEIKESELGHVAGGKTDKAVRKFQDDADIKIDGVVGRVTYGKMEERVEREIAQNPNMRAELLQMAKNYKEADQEEAKRLAGEFNKQPKQEAADVSRPATELAALSQRSTGRDGVPS